MAESAVSFLLDKLSVLLQQEKQLLGGLEQEVQNIQGEMGHMQAFLRVADAKEESNPQLKEWVTQIRDIAYDAEDVLDIYVLKFGHHARRNGFRGRMRRIYIWIKLLKSRHQLAVEIQTIKSRIDNVSQGQQRYRDMYQNGDPRLSSTLSSIAWYDGRGDALLLDDADIVGIEKPKNQLVQWLNYTDSGLKAISVVGMGGLGKTTLVRKVYDDNRVKNKFDHHLWITVSETAKVEHLLGEMIKSLVDEVKQSTPQGLDMMNADKMREFIYRFLQHKSYVVVLDDVWRLNVWEAIRYAFPKSGSSRGCIIITTRFNSIGNAACSETNGHVYNLEQLPPEESKRLFYKKAFPGDTFPPPHLKEASENILKRCEGLPLAIVVIGGLLATKNKNREEWDRLSRSLGHELEGDNLKRMMKLLSLSYYDLPYYLKSCFLYLNIFSEYELLEKWRVIRLWIAEGFVQEKQGKTVEEVAEGYLNELLNRNLVQVAKTVEDGRPKEFRIHDLVREFIILKSRDQNIVATIGREEIKWQNKIRRLAIHNFIRYTQVPYDVEHLRALLCSDYEGLEFEPILRKVLDGGRRLLKQLDLRGAPLHTIPNEVFKLYNLKYLSLRSTKVQVIPKSIKHLIDLETLDLKNSQVTELPVEILKLMKLRHVILYSYQGTKNHIPYDNIQGFKAPCEIGLLSSLQKLTSIDADETDGIKIVTEVGKLTQLQRLGITKLRRKDGPDLCDSLVKLTNLHSLSISAVAESEILELQLSHSDSILTFLRTLSLRGRLESLPQWMASLDGLTRLVLRWSRLSEDPLQLLQGLPNLVALDMDSAYDGELLSSKAGGFQKLKILNLSRFRGLKGIKMEKGSMPQLQILSLWDCKLVAEVPEGIQNLAHLKYVEFNNMAEEFVERLIHQKRKGGEEWKLPHVPKVFVYSWEDGKRKGGWLQKL